MSWFDDVLDNVIGIAATVAAVYFAPAAAAAVFGELAAGSVVGTMATEAVAAGALNVVGQGVTGGEGSVADNFLAGAGAYGINQAAGAFGFGDSGASGGGAGTPGVDVGGPITPGTAVGADLPTLSSPAAGLDTSSAALSGADGVAGSSAATTPALDMSNLGQGAPTPVATPGSASTVGVSGDGSAPAAGLNTSASAGPPAPAGAATPPTAGLNPNASMGPPAPAQQSLTNALAPYQTPGSKWNDFGTKALDKMTDPGTLINLGMKGAATLTNGGAYDKMQASQNAFQDATNTANATNMAAAAKKSTVADNIVSKGNNLDPAYYAAQAGGAFGITRDRQWDDRLQQLQAQNASPDQIASEQRKFSFDTSLGKQTAYQDQYGRAQQSQISTLGTGAGLYTGVTAPGNATGSAVAAYGAKAGESPAAGFASTLEDVFGAQQAKNKKLPGAPAGSGASDIASN